MELSAFDAFTAGMITLLLGKSLTKHFKPLQEFNIPEPVVGGLAVSGVFALVYFLGGVEITMDLAVRDALILYFFTSIGLNAKLSTLLKGGKGLVIVLGLTIGYMLLQNVLGTLAVTMAGKPAAAGVLGGTASFIGGHGTAIAWSPRIAEDFGVEGAGEFGIACATLGLIAASLSGGPIAKILIQRFNLKPKAEETPIMSETFEKQPETQIDYVEVVRALLALHVAMGMGIALSQVIGRLGLTLPTFVPCLICGIVLTNIVPTAFPKVPWPAGRPAMGLIGDVALGVFLSMSLMDLKLWTLFAMLGPILIVLAVQLVGILTYIFFVVFPLTGKDYDAAVTSAGFAGFGLGATPTALANMNAVVQKHGAAPQAFLVIPLVGAFFVDLANAIIIPLVLRVVG